MCIRFINLKLCTNIDSPQKKRIISACRNNSYCVYSDAFLTITELRSNAVCNPPSLFLSLLLPLVQQRVLGYMKVQSLYWCSSGLWGHECAGMARVNKETEACVMLKAPMGGTWVLSKGEVAWPHHGSSKGVFKEPGPGLGNPYRKSFGDNR